MKTENKNMNNNCEQTQLLIEDYLDGMISNEDKEKMEKHVSSCNDCKAYLEYTIMLIDNTMLMAKNDMVTDAKKAALWNKIETGITSRSSGGEKHIYNMSGLEDEYITPANKYHEPSRWATLRYYVSGLAAVFVLAFIIYLVSQYRKGSEINVVSTDIVNVSAKWKVSNLKGSPMIDNLLMKNSDSISIGQYLITDDTSRAELTVGNLGTVTVEPNSKVRFVKSSDGENRVELVYGTLDADILAKPRSFFVDAGKVTAVDLGCAYKISMDEKGDGLLYVKSGRVSLESAGGRGSLVPEGKFCVLKKDFGPGTPFRGDTSPQLKKALMDFDFGDCGTQCVNVILKNAKKTDAVTLLNIIPRVDDEYKTIVYNKVSNYCPPPKNLPKDSIPKCIRIDKLNEWVDKVMEEVHKNIEENMKVLEENMKNFDHEKWENWGKEFGKNFKDNWKFEYEPMDTNVKYDFNFQMPSQEEMQDLQEDLKDMQKDLKLDNEQFKKEMEELKKEMQRVGEDIKKEELEKQKDAIERQKDAEDRMKEMQERQKEMEQMMKEKHEKMEKKDMEKDKDKDKDENDNKDNDNN